MSVLGAGEVFMLGAADEAAYVIPKSLRFNSGDSASLSKTFATTGNRKTWTWSAWVKRSGNNNGGLFGNYYSDDSFGTLFFNSDQLQFSANTTWFKTTQVFRDFSSFYHIVLAVDTTLATAGDRVRLYINGSEVNDFATENNPSQNANLGPSNSAETRIGRDGSNYFNGLLADIQFVDGQALAPTDFGETRSSDGVWVPKEASFTSPNDGTTWSNDLTATSSGAYFATNAGAADAFDSDLDNSAISEPNGSTITWSPTGGIDVSLSLRVYRGSDTTSNTVNISVNGGSSQSFARSSWVDLSFTGTLTSLAVSSPSANPGLSAVEVDGVILVDGAGKYGKNGFHLNFSDSSTNEALGFDSAPTIPDPDPEKGMDVITYTGNGGTQNIGGLSFEPGLVWIKNRSSDRNHYLYDSIRGAGTDADLSPNTTDAENSLDTGIYGYLSGFNPDGFTVVNGSNSTGNFNSSSQNYVAWTWRAGGPAVSNSDGTINAEVSANTDYGFSIVKWTANNSYATIGHGLTNQTPKFILVKSTASGINWVVYHHSLGNTKGLNLNLSGTGSTAQDYWNNTSPTTSVFSVGNFANYQTAAHVAYVWSEVSGYSKFGSYNGSGSANTKVTTGFKPKFIIARPINDSNGNRWNIIDTERGVDAERIFAEDSAVYSARQEVIIEDDGFTVINTTTDSGSLNRNTEYIYAAFADRPGNNWDVNNIVTNEGLTASKTQFDVVTYTGNGGSQVIGGPSYSAHATNPSSYNGSAANLFDGSLSTSWQNTDTGGTTYASVDLTRGGASSGVAFTTSFEMYGAFSYNQVLEIVHAGGTHTYNGNPGGSGAWVDFTSSLTSPVTTVRFKDSGGTGTPSWNAIRVDNEILIDGDDGPGLKFQPDLIWIKARGSAFSHVLQDSVRGFGSTKLLSSNSTGEENRLTDPTDGAERGYISGTSSTGFTIVDGTGTSQVNGSNETYVAWCWKAGGTAASNTDGSITSSVSANTDYGFSVVTWTGTATAGTIGHGLNGKIPKLIITKRRDSSGGWYSQHASLGATYRIRLNLNSAATSGTSLWNSTSPTDSVFSVGADNEVNASSGTFVAYCFADVPGYQRIGSYTGNGSSTGPVVVTGFKPRFLIIKRTDAGPSNWYLLDTERDSSNSVNALLRPNISDAEVSAVPVDMLQNGFQLKDTDAGSNASGGTYIYLAIGDDEIGSDEDCLVDVPNAVTADADATDTTGGYQRGNYATLNPLLKASTTTLSNGNLDYTNSVRNLVRSTIAIPQAGKWYFETTVTGETTGGDHGAGLIVTSNTTFAVGYVGQVTGSYGYYGDGNKYANGAAGASYGSSFGPGDTIGIAFDADGGNLYFYKNGVAQNSGTAAFTGLTDQYFFAIENGPSGSMTANFGQMPFKYGLPSGYATLNTTALPAATIKDGSTAFDVVTYTGDGNSTRTITNIGFSPDLVWTKARNQAYGQNWYDIVRTAGKVLRSDTTDAEATNHEHGYLSAFNSDGYTMSAGTTSAKNSNELNTTYVAWLWDAGDDANPVSNTDGSVTSSVRANSSAGFSIVKYSLSGSSAETIGHGLNSSLGLLITKATGTTNGWAIWHSAFSDTQGIAFTTGAVGTQTWWDQSNMTNSVFAHKAGTTSSQGGDIIAYCFAPVAGFSAFGSFTTNGSADGPFVYTGFRPAFILYKYSNTTGNWAIFDSRRSTYNVMDDFLLANSSQAEATSANIDFLSNGFKFRISLPASNTIIYAAFAENPFQANGGLAR